jgi:hypothetical protein
VSRGQHEPRLLIRRYGAVRTAVDPVDFGVIARAFGGSDFPGLLVLHFGPLGSRSMAQTGGPPSICTSCTTSKPSCP